MTDREDAAVDEMQVSAAEAPVDGLPAEAEQQQLRTSDNTVLGGREPRNLEVHGALASHTDV